MSEAQTSGVLPAISATRLICDYPIGNISIADHHASLLGGAAQAHPDAWLDAEEITAFLASNSAELVDENGIGLAWKPSDGGEQMAFRSFVIQHPWDLIRANEGYVAALKENKIEGDIHPAAVIEGVIHLGEGSRILPGVYIEGNVVIARDCKIGPNCYLRGNTSIGDHCHIGQSVEIKNSLILSKSNVGHLSYVGDSVIGANANLGAGTITSNLRHDGKNHRSAVNGILVDTGRRKFGAIVGDGVHTGINTTIYPGRKLCEDVSTRPGEIVQKDIHR
ncbi:MAG: hypothetical protein V4733_08335 [Verrucomicrobiota bacterium]